LIYVHLDRGDTTIGFRGSVPKMDIFAICPWGTVRVAVLFGPFSRATTCGSREPATKMEGPRNVPEGYGVLGRECESEAACSVVSDVLVCCVSKGLMA
jgi:hypothetical protein